VFGDDVIDGYILFKMEESYAFEHTPAPDRVQDVLFGLTRHGRAWLAAA
jgi:hypothetical protein